MYLRNFMLLSVMAVSIPAFAHTAPTAQKLNLDAEELDFLKGGQWRFADSEYSVERAQEALDYLQKNAMNISVQQNRKLREQLDGFIDYCSPKNNYTIDHGNTHALLTEICTGIALTAIGTFAYIYFGKDITRNQGAACAGGAVVTVGVGVINIKDAHKEIKEGEELQKLRDANAAALQKLKNFLVSIKDNPAKK